MPSLAERTALARRLLHRSFGYADFRPLQRRVVQSVLAGRDTLAILPTGGGKSICFQVPGLVLGGLTVVISPLVALMQDQVAALQARGIAAETLNSLLPEPQQHAILERLSRRALQFLYVSPERAPRIAADLARLALRPSLLAIDEAHCISEWGHDFRPSYRALAAFRTAVGTPPTVALTGSATPEVRADIVRVLGFARHDLHLGSFDRPNLWFGVRRIRRRQDRLPALIALLERRPGLTIVYTSTRNSTDALAQRLAFAGHRSAGYHAGLTRERRSEVLGRFLGGELDVVVATSAFGMGIDAPRVRLVAHWGMPPTPEAYYQEAGRAGRDGQPSQCVLLHHQSDGNIHRRQLEVTFPPRAVLEEIWRNPRSRPRFPVGVVASADRLGLELGVAAAAPDWARVERRKGHALTRLKVVERYATQAPCRRRLLLGYFGESATECSGCDACEDPAHPLRRLAALLGAGSR